jgi:hypothetical protein
MTDLPGPPEPRYWWDTTAGTLGSVWQRNEPGAKFAKTWLCECYEEDAPRIIAALIALDKQECS